MDFFLGLGLLTTMWETVFVDVGVVLREILKAVRLQRMDGNNQKRCIKNRKIKEIRKLINHRITKSQKKIS